MNDSSARDIIHLAVAIHSPTHVFGLFSGGHDSLVACHVLSQSDHPTWSVVHINTGIGVRETSLTEQAESSGTAASVAALSRGVEAVSRAIVEAIRSTL